MSASAASRRFGVARSTAILWIQRYRKTGDVSASPMGRPRGMKVAAFGDFIMARMKNKDTTLDILHICVPTIIADVSAPLPATRRNWIFQKPTTSAFAWYIHPAIFMPGAQARSDCHYG